MFSVVQLEVCSVSYIFKIAMKYNLLSLLSPLVLKNTSVVLIWFLSHNSLLIAMNKNFLPGIFTALDSFCSVHWLIKLSIIKKKQYLGVTTQKGGHSGTLQWLEEPPIDPRSSVRKWLKVLKVVGKSTQTKNIRTLQQKSSFASAV